MLPDSFWFVNISQIDDDRRCHHISQTSQIKCSKLFPLGYDNQGVRALCTMICAFAIRELRQDELCLIHRGRIERAHIRAHVLEGCNKGNRRSFAEIVRIWFKGKSKD